MVDAAPRETVPTRSNESLQDLRSSVRWVLAASAAVAAVLVAGVQLRDIPAIGTVSQDRVVVALVSVAIAVFLVIAFLTKAAAIFASPILTIRDLSERDLRARTASHATPAKPLKDELIQKLFDQRTYLHPNDPTLHAFYLRYSEAIRAHEQLIEAGEVTFDGRTLRSRDPSDVDHMANAVLTFSDRAVTIEDAARLYQAQGKFRELIRRFWWGGPLFVICIAVFVYFTRQSGEVTITSPTEVTLSTMQPGTVHIPPGCHLSPALTGVVIGGTFANPVVVTHPSKGCPSFRIGASEAAVVVPRDGHGRPSG